MQSVNGSGMKRALLIHDYSCFGKCSLSVGVPILSALGVEAVALPTAILSTHTGGFDGYAVHTLTQEMAAFCRHWDSFGLRFDGVYTGFFTSAAQIRLCREQLRAHEADGALVLVDPVLGDNGAQFSCFDDEFAAEMRALARHADWLTPNRTEAALLTGLPMDAPPEALLALLPSPNAVITGVEEADSVGYLARIGSERLRIFYPKAALRAHGAGDVFASALCAQLLRGCAARGAVEWAAAFCDRCIRATVKRLPAHWYGLAFEDVLCSGMESMEES
ncbi:MAG: PfkB family carbohydrate kinase [Firmicutes bacterium]|nr:PfkB family carbohydrate kinase [Bacillota bacterium]